MTPSELQIDLEPTRYIVAFGYCLPRFLGFFSLLPLLTKEVLPMTLRMGLVSCLGLVLVPMLLEPALQERPPMQSAFILGREAVLGTVIGLVMAIPLWAMEAMGNIVDTQRGTSMSQVLNPLTGQEASPLGQLFNQSIVTFLFTTGGFLVALSVVYDSFLLWPVFDVWPGFGPDAGGVMLGLLDHLMLLTVLLSAPVVFAMFLAESGLALVSRFVPQLQVFFLAMPIKSGIAMVVFAIYAAVLFDTAHAVLEETFADCAHTVGEILRHPGKR
jgi:type III secretion protein T